VSSGRRWDATTEEQTHSGRVKTIAGVVITLLATGAGLIYLWHYNNKQFPGPLAGDDAELLEFMHDSDAREARQWLKERDARSLLGMSRDQSTRFIDQLYELGAKRVIAYGGQVSATVIVELPDAKSQRTALFDFQNRRGMSGLAPIASDIGQRYLLVGLKV